ncbi:MAG: VOC family protein [Acidimicrobiia bacterium]|nr:VOC family protein [Acidimicrobiia bacterium]NNK90836.1 VOC family protein [Acidimicrobiia bacterium]
MARVTGIGGVFFKSRDPEGLTAWYQEHLGLPVDDEGFVVLKWGGEVAGSTVWGPFPEHTSSFEWPADLQWMINYRVDDLEAMLDELRKKGVDCSADTFEDMNGRFGHCWDPEGNRIQLWQPHPGM